MTDSTGSMSSAIASVQEGVQKIVNSLAASGIDVIHGWWVPALSPGNVDKTKAAPVTEYVEIPDGSSSAAPVMSPGPSCFTQSRNLRRIEIPLDRGGL